MLIETHQSNRASAHSCLQGRAAAPSGTQDSGANAPLLYRGAYAAQFGRRRRADPAMKVIRSTKKTSSRFEWVHESFLFLERGAPFLFPPERLPRRAVRGLGAHSPHQAGPLLRARDNICAGDVLRQNSR